MSKSHSSSYAFSADSPAMSLTFEQRQRLTNVLDEYLSGLETGAPPDQKSLLEEHTDLADALRVHFRSLEGLHSLAAGGNAPLHIVPTRGLDPTGTIGDFELLREIGRGGMGVVYEARQISLNRRVAVKLLPFVAILDPKQIARFKLEAQAAAQINHPHIVPVFAVGIERGIHYYAMEFVDGQPLDRVITQLRQMRGRRDSTSGPTSSPAAFGNVETRSERRSHTLPLQLETVKRCGKEHFESIAQLGIQAAEALHAAHEYGIVHRDIKPANLLLDGSGKLWITDFGLARWQREVSLTRTGDFVGTMRYMSPEQAAGRPAFIDQRTDVYSLGATLYELVCLRAAFPDDHSPALLRQVERCEPPRPRQFCPQVPRDLEMVILKAMAKSRDDRYGTAQELADDLRRVLEGKPTLAKPPTISDCTIKWLGRHRRVVSAGACAALALLIGLSTAVVMIAREKQAAERNSLRAERNVGRAKRYFGDAREVLDHFGVELSERLAEIPGAEDVRSELLHKSLQYYEGFAKEAKGDPALQSDLALAYGKIAGLTAQTGSTAQAIAAHERSVALYAELADHHPSLENQRRLALGKSNLAMLLNRGDEYERAEQLFHEAIHVQRQLAMRSPHGLQVQADLAASLSNLGLLQNRMKLTTEAQVSLRSAINLLDELRRLESDHEGNLRRIAIAYNNLASTYLEVQPKRAIELHTQALETLVEVAKDRPDSYAVRRELALTLNNLAAAYSRAARIEDAIESYERAIEIQRRLARQAPSRRLYQSELALTYNNLGLALGRGGRLPESQEVFRKALDIHESLIAHDPTDVSLQSSTGSMYNNLGIVLEQSEQLEAAATTFEEAIQHQRAAMDDSGKAKDARNLLDKHLAHYGRVLEKLGKLDEAARQAGQRRELWSGDPQRLYSIAADLSRIYGQMEDGPQATAMRDQCANMAMDTLSAAVASGFELPGDLPKRQPFSALSHLPSFAQLFEVTPK